MLNRIFIFEEKSLTGVGMKIAAWAWEADGIVRKC